MRFVLFIPQSLSFDVAVCSAEEYGSCLGGGLVLDVVCVCRIHRMVDPRQPGASRALGRDLHLSVFVSSGIGSGLAAKLMFCLLHLRVSACTITTEVTSRFTKDGKKGRV